MSQFRVFGVDKRKDVLSSSHEFELMPGSHSLLKNRLDESSDRYLLKGFVVSPSEFIVSTRADVTPQKALALRLSLIQGSRVSRFIHANNLQDVFHLAKSLINDLVPGVLEIKSQLEYDAETGERWINFLVKVKAEVSEILEADDKLVDRWLEGTPPEQSDLIRINYKFVE